MNIKKFDLNEINSLYDKAILIISDETEIKYSLIEHITKQLNLPVKCAINTNLLNENFYSSIVGYIYVHNNYNSNLINNIYKRQRLMMEKNVKNKTNIDIRAQLIIDTNQNVFQNHEYLNILARAKHYKISHILTTNCEKIIPDFIISYFDYIFISKTTNTNINIDEYNRFINSNNLTISLKKSIKQLNSCEYFLVIDKEKNIYYY